MRGIYITKEHAAFQQKGLMDPQAHRKVKGRKTKKGRKRRRKKTNRGGECIVRDPKSINTLEPRTGEE